LSLLSSLFSLSVGAKQCDGLDIESVHGFNGKSKAAWGDGFNHICLLITLPSAALVLCWDINSIQQLNTPPPSLPQTRSVPYVLVSVQIVLLYMLKSTIRDCHTDKRMNTY